MKYLKLEIGNDYDIEFLNDQSVETKTKYGNRYEYPIVHDNENKILSATDKLRMQINFYFKLHKENKAKLSVFNGGNQGVKYFEYLLIPNK